MGLPIVSAEWWVATDPELRFEQDGSAKLRMRLKAQDRHYDREKKEWVNGKELWVNATVWRQQAENVGDSIKKGDNVVASGKLSTRDYVGNDGSNKTSLDFEVTEIGPSLRFRTTPHGAGGGGQRDSARGQTAGGSQPPAAAPETATQTVSSEPPW